MTRFTAGLAVWMNLAFPLNVKPLEPLVVATVWKFCPAADGRPRLISHAQLCKPPGTLYSLKCGCCLSFSPPPLPSLLPPLAPSSLHNAAMSDAVSASSLTGRVNTVTTTANAGRQTTSNSRGRQAHHNRDSVRRER